VRLVEGADQVLAERMVHADLAADGAVHLRQQCRRHMDECDAPQIGGCSEAGQIADYAATKRDEGGRAIGICLDERLVDPADRGALFVAFAVGNEDRLGIR
jgi:hypothetical protein